MRVLSGLRVLHMPSTKISTILIPWIQSIFSSSGDHIYKMDYEDMLAKHKKSNAALSVAVIDVPWDEASRFGIMNTDENDRIIEFEEKPKNQRATTLQWGSISLLGLVCAMYY